MVEFVRASLDKPEITYQGLSTDTKPTANIDNNATYYELNTKKMFKFSENNINPATSNGWWEV
jgi:hypothetical protein